MSFVFAYALNFFPFIEVYLPQKNFVLMGMAGVMAGVMHAPLTGTFLIAELTGGLQPAPATHAGRYLLLRDDPHLHASQHLLSTLGAKGQTDDPQQGSGGSHGDEH